MGARQNAYNDHRRWGCGKEEGRASLKTRRTTGAPIRDRIRAPGLHHGLTKELSSCTLSSYQCDGSVLLYLDSCVDQLTSSPPFLPSPYSLPPLPTQSSCKRSFLPNSSTPPFALPLPPLSPPPLSYPLPPLPPPRPPLFMPGKARISPGGCGCR